MQSANTASSMSGKYSFRRRDLNRRGLCSPRLAVGAAEGGGLVRAQPVAHGGQAGKGIGPNLRPDLGDHVPDAVGLKLLGERALLLHVLPLVLAIGRINGGRSCQRDRPDLVKVGPALWQAYMNMAFG